MLNDKIKIFIEKNIKLIEYNKWDTIYAVLDYASDITPKDIGEFTLTMLDCGINPLEHMHYIPQEYLCAVDFLTCNKKVRDLIREFTIPNNILNIDESAFQENEIIEKLIIPKSVARIHKAAFWGCENLKDITYLGTVDDWILVGEEDETIFQHIPTDIIHCTDGDFSISDGERIQ